MAKYLDQAGLQTVWDAVKAHDIATLNSAKGYADGLNTSMDSRVDTLEGYFTSGKANEALKATKDGDGAIIASTYVKLLQLGVATPSGANPEYIGVATLGTDGKVPSSQLPSFVDDVIEGYYYQNKFYSDSAHTTEITGEAGKIYVDLSTMKTYRWSGSAYVVISETLAIGITQGTAYDGAAGYALSQEVATLNATVANIPTTYVPQSSGSGYGDISNTTSGIEFSFGGATSTSSTTLQIIDSAITLTKKTSNSVVSELEVSGSGVIVTGSNFKWQTAPNTTAKDVATIDDITLNAFTINGISAIVNKAVNLVTNTAYNASTNKLATMSDVPVVEAISSADLATILV